MGIEWWWQGFPDPSFENPKNENWEKWKKRSHTSDKKGIITEANKKTASKIPNSGGRVRFIPFLVISVICIGTISCNHSGEIKKAEQTQTEEKLIRFLDKVAPELAPIYASEQKHKLDPKMERVSEFWEIKKAEDAPWDRARPKREHTISVAGIVLTYGGSVPEVSKFVRLSLSYQGFSYSDNKYTNRVMTIQEAQKFSASIDSAIKVQSQAALGGVQYINYTQDLGFGLSITGNHHKQSDWEKKAPEFTLALHVDEASLELRSSDWMELKLKIEAALKWLDTQNGDGSLFADPKSNASTEHKK